MNKPVVAADGHTYELTAIHEAMMRQLNPKSPMTGEVLGNIDHIPNHLIKSMIEEWRFEQSRPKADASVPASAPASAPDAAPDAAPADAAPADAAPAAALAAADGSDDGGASSSSSSASNVAPSEV